MIAFLVLSALTGAPASPLAVLPNDTMAVVSLSSPAGLLDSVGAPAAVAAIRKAMGKESVRLEEEVLLGAAVPANWRAHGLDPQRPLALSVSVSEGYPVAALTVAVSDAAALERALGQLAVRAKTQVMAKAVGDHTVLQLSSDDQMAVLLRGRWATLVMGNSPESLAGFVARLAQLPESEALDPALSGTGPHGGGLVRLSALAAALDAFSGTGPERSPAKLIASGLGDLRFGLDLTRGLEVEVHATFHEPNPWVDALVSQPGGFSVLSAAHKPLHFVCGVRVDPVRFNAAVTALAEGMRASDELEKAKAALREETGYDWDKDLVPIFTGELGFAVAGKLTEAERREDFPFTEGGAVTIGVVESLAATFLEKVLAEMGFDKDPGAAWRVRPRGSVPMHFALERGVLIVSETVAAVERFLTPQPHRLDPTRELLAGEHVAILAFDAAWALREEVFESAAVAYAEPDEPPASKALAANQAKIDAVQAKLAAIRAADRANDEKDLTALARVLGTTWFTVDRSSTTGSAEANPEASPDAPVANTRSDRLVIRGGQRLASESPAAFVKDATRLVLRQIAAQATRRKKTAPLYERLQRLYEERSKLY